MALRYLGAKDVTEEERVVADELASSVLLAESSSDANTEAPERIRRARAPLTRTATATAIRAQQRARLRLQLVHLSGVAGAQ